MGLAGSLTPGEFETKKSLVAGEWLVRVLETYPGDKSQQWRLDSDPFRNPVGHALKDGLSVLVEELLGGMSVERVTPALDSIIRLRAVQDLTASQAVAFVFLLREIVRKHLGEQEAVVRLAEQRIDRLAAEAFDLFMECREKMYEIKANALVRSMYVQTRRDHKSALN